MNATIHPSAVVSSKASIGDDVTIGPFCVIGDHVTIEDDVELKSHVVIEGHTTIGKGCRIFPFASLGHAPQDLKYKNEPSSLIIGEYNIIREHTTMNPGTKGGGMATVIGDHCLFMMSTHVAHDCRVGNHVIMANNATLAGHVKVDDFAIIGGLSAVHQFVKIGAHAMIGGMSGVENDVIPYGLVSGERAHLQGLNLVGLKRRHFSRDDIATLRSAYRLLFAPEGTLEERTADTTHRFGNDKGVAEIIEFVKQQSSRALCQPKHKT